MFAIETLTKSKITEVSVLSQKNRDVDSNPGVALSFSLELRNHYLSYFDGFLKAMLYTKSEASSGALTQATLGGVEEVSDMPNLTGIGQKIGRLHWNMDLTGYSLEIDHGMGGKSNLHIEDCVLSKFRIDPKEGGTCTIDFMLEAQDVTEKVFGKLATLKNREVQIVLTPPDVGAQGSVEG